MNSVYVLNITNWIQNYGLVFFERILYYEFDKFYIYVCILLLTDIK